MEVYTGFAEVYDLFMDNVPYQEWGEYLIGLLEEYKISDGLVLDLGCGTGSITRLLAKHGYDMIGVDLSSEMLEIARQKEETDSGILYLNQDMREFELYGTVRAVVSICDSMNYLLEESDILQVLSLVKNYLDPGGVFLFDMNTIYKYKELLGDTTICENREEGSFIWENYYDEEEHINEYDLTLFIKERDGRYSKYEETHFQRGYEIDRIQSLIEGTGLKLESVFHAGTKELPNEESERIYFIVRKVKEEE